ncbi:MAG: hypothetical protein NZ480_08985 [Bdellovibrionaceae bacterium]|nr:hypothetical protein [Pseudobdellovibrionaceae bacterium]MDW8189395.1 hypothetical protein [Pseudobdellovibrionaceae bacterium]
MYLQGNLQEIFDALYAIGAIQRVIQKDWHQIVQFRQSHWQVHRSLVEQLNETKGSELFQFLQHLSEDFQNVIALEVANELVEYTQRTQIH